MIQASGGKSSQRRQRKGEMMAKAEGISAGRGIKMILIFVPLAHARAAAADRRCPKSKRRPKSVRVGQIEIKLRLEGARRVMAADEREP